jgi:hypothetical protein
MAVVTNKHTPDQDREIREKGTATIRSHVQVSLPIGFLPILVQMLNVHAQSTSSLVVQPVEEK